MTNFDICPEITPVKLRAEQMVVFALDYGDLIRPAFEILPSRGWGQCTNQTGEHLVVYGPKHAGERSIFDTTPYVLPPGSITPDNWDCDGFLLPADREIRRWNRLSHGPRAIKFWNHRRFWVRSEGAAAYRCSWDNGIFEPSQINWAIPNFIYRDICSRLEGIKNQADESESRRKTP